MLYRAKSTGNNFSSPLQNVRDWSTMRSNRIRSANGTIHMVDPLPQLPLDSPIPAPPQYNFNSKLQSPQLDLSTLGPMNSLDSVSQHRLPRMLLNNTSGVTLYDDVATGSTITVLSQSNGVNARAVTYPSSQFAPQLPRMAEMVHNEDGGDFENENGDRATDNYLYADSLPQPPDQSFLRQQQQEQQILLSVQKEQRQHLPSQHETADGPVYHSIGTYGRQNTNESGQHNTDDTFNN